MPVMPAVSDMSGHKTVSTNTAEGLSSLSLRYADTARRIKQQN